MATLMGGTTWLPQTVNQGGWLENDTFYPLSPPPIMAKVYNDAGADAAKVAQARDAYKATAESACKSAHPVASKVSGVGRKPYTNCVNDKMSAYDSILAATQKSTAASSEDQAFNDVVEKLTGTPAAASGALASSENTTLIVGSIAGVVLLIALVFWFRSRGQATAPPQK